ncbi:VWA domain-containing protein [Nocardioides caeni]|uniref:VWA domain-containing protein n=1 Tax=Nocardioides caeni TaxID=574700 RepID=A0A4S8NLI3_9ACTN|nr:VWA domain-containing protein [Nocardioides caeni]THV17728.1 VWA domain-containing protein [Nocardioides caeni]
MTNSQQPPPGWYPDPSGRPRWWDGTAWGGYATTPDPAPTTSPDAGTTPPAPRRRRRAVAVIAACLAAVIAGVGIAWVAFDRPDEDPADEERPGLTAIGYAGVDLGDSRATVLEKLDYLDEDEVAETGIASVAVDDGEIVLIDGEVVEIHSTTDDFATPEDVRPGDDLSAADEEYAVYGSDGEESRTVTDSTVTYVADVEAETGYRFTFEPDGSSTIDQPSGEITDIAIVNHIPTFTSAPVMVVLDSSGSMEETDVYPSRWDAAVGATYSLIDAMPARHEVGLTVYGAGENSYDECQDVSVPIPVSPLDRESFKSTLANYGPVGLTPISLALSQAAAQLPTGEEATIVLVSDGLDTCEVPPCETAADLKEANPDLTIHTIGFSVDGGARAELSCIAEAGGGVSVPADNQALLASRLAALFNSEAAETSLRPDSYEGVELGDELSELQGQHGGAFDDVAATGRVEVVFIDCVVVIEDGVVVEIQSSGARTRTVDDLRVGDDIGRAHELYAGSYAPRVEDGSITYVADPVQRTGYRFDYEPDDGSSSEDPHGLIRKIVICRCVDDLLPEQEGIFRVQVAFTGETFVNMRKAHQLDRIRTKANERAYEEAVLEVVCYVEGFTYRSKELGRSSNLFARVADSDLYVATLFLSDDYGQPIEDDVDFPAC